MKVLKKYLQATLTFSLIFLINMAFANTTTKTEGQEQEQEGNRRKSDQTMMRPDMETSSEPISQERQEENSVESNSGFKKITYENSTVEPSDTVKDESVSKYNFIFYFLYKFKYDAEEAP